MENNVLRTAAWIILGWALVALIILAMSGCVDGLGDRHMNTGIKYSVRYTSKETQNGQI